MDIRIINFLFHEKKQFVKFNVSRRDKFFLNKKYVILFQVLCTMHMHMHMPWLCIPMPGLSVMRYALCNMYVSVLLSKKKVKTDFTRVFWSLDQLSKGNYI